MGGAGNAPVVTSDVIFFDTGFTDRQSGRRPLAEIRLTNDECLKLKQRPFGFHDLEFFRYSSFVILKMVAGVGVAPTEAELMRLA